MLRQYSYNGLMDEIRVVIGKGGRINVPARHRRALGLSEGDEVIVGIEDDALRITTRRAAIRRARAIVSRYVPEEISLVDELLADRREEAAREAVGEAGREAGVG